jgi:intron-binding protein aquarius
MRLIVDDATKAKLRFDQSWLYSLIIDFVSILHSPGSRSDGIESRKLTNIAPALSYCERFVEFLIDLQSQLPTRKYTNVLLQDLHVLVATRLSPLYKDPKNTLLHELVEQLDHYIHFAVNSYTSAPLSEDDIHAEHCHELANLQRIALTHFKEKLSVLALSNYASIDKPAELIELLTTLDDEELVRLCQLLNLRTSYPDSTHISIDRDFLLQVLLETFQKRETFVEKAQKLSVYPTETSLFDPRILEYESLALNSRPLPLPKINLQYLSIPDFLFRSFLLSRYESLFQIRRDIEDVIRVMKPRLQYPAGTTVFQGYSKMAITIPKIVVTEVLPPNVGEDWPSLVKGEVFLDLETLPKHARREWAQIREGDMVFSVKVQVTDGDKKDYAAEMGVRVIRTAEVVQVLDEEGRPMRMMDEDDERYLVPRRRTLRLRLDARQWKEDNAAFVEGKSEDVYESINALIRRRPEVGASRWWC